MYFWTFKGHLNIQILFIERPNIMVKKVNCSNMRLEWQLLSTVDGQACNKLCWYGHLIKVTLDIWCSLVWHRFSYTKIISYNVRISDQIHDYTHLAYFLQVTQKLTCRLMAAQVKTYEMPPMQFDRSLIAQKQIHWSNRKTSSPSSRISLSSSWQSNDSWLARDI